MNSSASNLSDRFRLTAGLSAMIIFSYLSGLASLNGQVDVLKYVVLGPLAVYLAYLGVIGLRAHPNHVLLKAFGCICLVVTGTLDGCVLYLSYLRLESIPYSLSCATSLVKYSMSIVETQTHLAPSVLVTIITFELGRTYFTGAWRWAYIFLTGLGVALIMIL